LRIDRHYILLIILHIILGWLVFNFRIVSKLYLLSIFCFYLYKIVFSNPSYRTLYVLKGCAYIVGAEVFIRMTGGSILYEASKYIVLIFSILGIFLCEKQKGIMYYFTYLLFLIPGVLIAGLNTSAETDVRRSIVFNITGPICIGIFSMFCYNRKISYKNIYAVLLTITMPLLSMVIYLFLYNTDIQNVVLNTTSNFSTSGGFGPNQVATILGLGMFIHAVFFSAYSPSIISKLIHITLLFLMSYRGIITFSRGGIFTAVIVTLIFYFVYYMSVTAKAKLRIGKFFLFFIGLGFAIWLVSSYQTKGLIDLRYQNKDVTGRDKEDISTGRSLLLSSELNEFLKHPVFGVGVGKIKETREKITGINVVSHNEISRLLSEHGSFGLLALSLLMIIPLVLHLKNRSNIFAFPLYVFWFLTINHSAMRIAAPAFIYGLCLLNIQYKNRVSKKENKQLHLA